MIPVPGKKDSWYSYALTLPVKYRKYTGKERWKRRSATGKYYNYKVIIDPMAADYKDRFLTYSQNQISRDGDYFNVDEDVNGSADYRFERRDFNAQEFLSNLVVRWEYSPGSSVYLVWSQTRSTSSDSGNLELFNDMGHLFSADNNKPHNIFLIKFSYRFGL